MADLFLVILDFKVDGCPKCRAQKVLYATSDNEVAVKYALRYKEELKLDYADQELYIQPHTIFKEYYDYPKIDFSEEYHAYKKKPK